jgi:hypothetical protein
MAGVEGLSRKTPKTWRFSFYQQTWRDSAPISLEKSSLFRLFVLAKTSFSRTARRCTEPRDVLLCKTGGSDLSHKHRKIQTSEEVWIFLWLGWRDSNPRMLVPETSALPLGDTPIALRIVHYFLIRLKKLGK